MIWPLNIVVPEASLISTLCGMPASLLLKWIVKGVFAGAVTAGCSNAMLMAEICTTPAPGDGAPGTGVGSAGEAGDAGAPDASAEAAGCEGGGAGGGAVGQRRGAAGACAG